MQQISRDAIRWGCCGLQLAEEIAYIVGERKCGVCGLVFSSVLDS